MLGSYVDRQQGRRVTRIRIVPSAGTRGPQERLRIYVGFRSSTKAVLSAWNSLLTRGPLSRYCTFEKVGNPELPAPLKACCQVLRKHGTLLPTVPRDMNPDVPDTYFTCEPFVPNEDNDVLCIDGILGGINEHVVIDVCVEKLRDGGARRQHAQYCSRLKQIDRPWQDHGEVWLQEDPLSESPHARLDHVQLKPFHQPDPSAQEILRCQQKLQETFREPYLSFHILALAEKDATARLLASTFAEQAFLEGSYRVLKCARRPRDSVRDALSSITPLTSSNFDPVTQEALESCGNQLEVLTRCASVGELIGAFRLPVARGGALQCARRNTDPPWVSEKDIILLGHDFPGGINGGREIRGKRVRDLPLSMFTTGLPGRGKTMSNCNIAIQLARRGIPFLIIECAKTEFRSLKSLGGHDDAAVSQLADNLQVFTAGNERVSPLRHNLFQFPEDMSVAEKTDWLLSCFEAALPMGGPVNAILAEALEVGLHRSSESGVPLLVEHLIQTAREVVRQKGYSGSTESDIEAAIDVRLGRLARGTIGEMFRCTHSLPDSYDILQNNTVLELDRLDDYPRALLSLSLLSKLLLALRSAPNPGATPRFVIFIEEAHRLLAPSKGAEASEEHADPRAYVVEMACQMLAELRALGVGVVISDQSPAKVAPEVIKLTGSKLAFQLVDAEDRQVIGASMLFGEPEFENIARLGVGQAYFYTSGYYAPQLITTVNLEALP